MSDRAYLLRFISGKYQGGEYPLQDSGELVIGRSSELDMVLIEDMVSRKHAKISLAPGQIAIADLGSTNGTFVNGEKIKKARLKEGDRILIGTSILKLVGAGRLPRPSSSACCIASITSSSVGSEISLGKGASSPSCGTNSKPPCVHITIRCSAFFGESVVSASMTALTTLPPRR